MLDEKKLLADLTNFLFTTEMNSVASKTIEQCIECVDNQPQADKCSRREWYQKGYQDGLNADKWIPCEVEMPKEEYGTYWIAVEQEEGFYYCSAVYTSEHGFRTMDIEAQGKIVAWRPIEPYKKEGAENE